MNKEISTPDPSLVADAYLRQILQALRLNQVTLFKALQVAGWTTTTQTQQTKQAAKLPVRSAGNAAVTAAPVTVALPADAVAANVASIATLANANKAAIIELAGEYNKLQGDVIVLAETLKNMQGQQAEIIKRLNQGSTG